MGASLLSPNPTTTMTPHVFDTFESHYKHLFEGPHSAEEAVHYFLERIHKHQNLNAYLHTYGSEAIAHAKHVDVKIQKGEKIGKLAGMVVGLKDLFCYKNHPVSASSAILKDFISQITASSVQRLLDEEAIIIGHQNCDEFAMGCTNTHSAYGPVGHPLDPNFSPGGSSGGSAAAVAARLCQVALGTDTGGSVRQPAAWCGLVGLKPTYGRIPRDGVVEFASSLDTVSLLSHTVYDCAAALEVMAGASTYDNTSSTRPVPSYTQLLSWNTSAKVACLKEAIEHPALAEDVRDNTLACLDTLTQHGHTINHIDCPWLDHALPTYHCLNTAEASANLARYDGIRYGQRIPDAKNIQDLYTKTRTAHLGKEVKRRILLGTFVLSARYYDAYYTQAQKVRRLLKNYLEHILETHDFIVLPTTPTTAQPRGTTPQDPRQEYLADLYTVLANISGLPAISIPNGTNPQGWPTGFQIIGKSFQEDKLLAFAQHLTALLKT